ncbi:MAG: SAM-dependent methyltransferase, partial [Aquiluna sp.]
EVSQWSIEGERAGKRYAVMIQEDGETEFSGEVFEADVAPLSEFIYEPDAALIRSHLIGELAQQLGLGVVSAGLAYLTGAEIESPWLRRF